MALVWKSIILGSVTYCPGITLNYYHENSCKEANMGRNKPMSMLSRHIVAESAAVDAVSDGRKERRKERKRGKGRDISRLGKGGKETKGTPTTEFVPFLEVYFAWNPVSRRVSRNNTGKEQDRVYVDRGRVCSHFYFRKLLFLSATTGTRKERTFVRWFLLEVYFFASRTDSSLSSVLSSVAQQQYQVLPVHSSLIRSHSPLSFCSCTHSHSLFHQ